ncbi:hypothetical protein GUJ93_ZPchr0001g31343 [Zizania palustris]|uniref:C2H2-type domain-containing protein n=1 Tax=Zizania palustris TaxID=103762 RepID=A0A8J5RJ42_ZIZPA|nr:hypothetical protein GUJ93_ZPchr0001g31343 [Zizania palustris]
MVEGCGRMYDKYQSLGGHAAGHANRVKQEAADLVVNSGNNDAKPERKHQCKSRRKGDGDEDVLPEYKRWRLEDIQTEVPSPPTLLSHTTSPDSERTNSDDGGVSTTAASVVWEVFRCGNCRREFNSRQTLHGHMRVHTLRKHRELDEKQPVNCASTDKRGRKGSKVVIACQGRRSVRPITNESPNQVVAHQQAVANRHSPQQPVAAPPQLLLLPQAAQGDQASGPPYRCKVEGCGRMFDKHQSRGEHAAGHANRVKQEAAALVVNGGNNDAKPERKQPMQETPALLKSQEDY